MNRSARLLLLLLLTAASLLATCNLPTNPVPTSDTCNPAELIAPVLTAPFEGEVVDLLPNFSWSYPIYCDPDRVAVQVCADPACHMVAASGEAEQSGSSWTPETSLEPATHYYWRAAGIALEGSEAVVGPLSAAVSFFTGPICDTSSPLPPILMQPAEGAWVDPPLKPPAQRYHCSSGPAVSTASHRPTASRFLATLRSPAI